MKSRIENRMAVIDLEIKDYEKSIENNIRNLKEALDSSRIGNEQTRASVKARYIKDSVTAYLSYMEYDEGKIRELEEQKRMLRFLLNDC